jgi:spore germination protein YaaH
VRRVRRRLSLGVLAAAALVALPTAAGASIAALGSSGARPKAAAQAPRARSARAPVAHAGACAGRSPARLRLRRLTGSAARLSWRLPASREGGGLVYRVYRNGRTVGQTERPSMVLEVIPGRRTVFSVQARYGGGALRCSAKLTETVPVREAGAVPGLKVLERTSAGVNIGWRPATRGDAPIIGYRVTLDGEVAGQTRARHYALIFNAARDHRVSVAAVDSQGRLGASSGVLTIGALHRPHTAGAPPSAPEGLSASEVGDTEATVLWLPSRPGATNLAGYRVYRDGVLVGQTATTSFRLTHLNFPQSYSITVSAVDTDGSESPRSQALTLNTVHGAPSPPSMLSAVSVTDTSATLSWQAGVASSGTVTGYLLFKDGEPVGYVQGQIVTVALASQRTYTFTVRTRDSAGYLSAPAPELTVVTTHTPPPAPHEVTASSVTDRSAVLSWQPSAAVSGTIVGYRVFRDDIPVGQSPATERTLEGLAPASDYSITVSAVDSLGAVSEPSAPVIVQTADPPPTHGTAQAYVLASTGESFEDLQAHYEQIGVVYPTYYDCGPSGEIAGQNDPLVTNWALARKIEVLPRVNCLNVEDEEQILNQPAVRERTIETIAAMCREYHYSGIQIDFENAPPSDREAFTSFITALAARLHGQGNKLSTVVTAKYWNVPTGRAAMYNDAALSVPSDYVFVLDWGYHWVTSGPGSIDEYNWFSNVAKYTATLPNLSKFVLGMPMYGVDWPNGGGPSSPGTALQYNEIVALAGGLGIAPEWDGTSQSPHFSYTSAGVAHQVWYVNQRSLSLRAALAASLNLKVGLWRLGHEDQTIWQLHALGGEGP